MRIVTLSICAAVAVSGLAACKRKEEVTPPPAPAAAPPVVSQTAPTEAKPTVTGFSHKGSFDAAGYYMPVQPIRAGAWQLQNLGIGAVSDFAQWEQGDRMSTFGPILIEFADTSSPLETNELGGEHHSRTVRVLPSAYSMDGKTLRFAGSDPKLGDVTFEGTLDTVAMATAKSQGASDQPVLNGTLTVGDNTFTNARFSFFAGD